MFGALSSPTGTLYSMRPGAVDGLYSCHIYSNCLSICRWRRVKSHTCTFILMSYRLLCNSHFFHLLLGDLLLKTCRSLTLIVSNAKVNLLILVTVKIILFLFLCESKSLMGMLIGARMFLHAWYCYQCCMTRM